MHPIKIDSNTLSLISTHSAYAMAHILEAYRSLSIVNTITKSALVRYCSAFELFKLPGRHGESFFVAIPVQRDLGYRGVSQSAVDLSSEAFVSGGQPGASR